MSLKWRITLITIVLMAVSCLILVLSINLNVAQTFTGISGVISIQSSSNLTDPNAQGGSSNTDPSCRPPNPRKRVGIKA